MRILQINASYKPAYIYGGPTMSVSKLSEQLVKAGCDITVFTTTANGPDELQPHEKTPEWVDGVPVYYFKRITKDHSHFSPGLLIAVWKQVKQFNVVHIHAWWNTVSVLSALISIMRGVPLIVSPRGTLSAYSFRNRNAFVKKCIHYLLGRPILKRCAIHATSQFEKETLKPIIKPKQIHIIPNFIKLSQKTNIKTTNCDKALKLIFLSRIEEKKGLDLLLNALPQINVPYHLTIAGTGNEVYIEQLKRLAEQNNVSHYISWIGLQGENKFDVMADHDLLVLPSYDENFGNVVIESLSVGTAVLISTKVGLADYVAENRLGWICDTYPTSIASAINDITRHYLNDIAQVAPEIIKRDFDENILVKKYTDMYQQVLQDG